MGEPSLYCHPPSEGCCLNLPETITILVALIIVVQLALKLASMVCYYLWYLVGVMFGMVVVQGAGRPKCAATRVRKICTPKPKPSVLWSEQDIPRHRRRKASSSPSRRCLHCTLEPLQVTMNLQNDPLEYREQYRVGRRPYADHPPYLAPRHYSHDYESRPRPRRASAPSPSRRRSALTRYRDAGVGSSDPIVGASGGNASERRNTAAGTELVPRHHAGEGSGPDAEHPGRRPRRPAKVYIYPVHPQTPPGSRSSSPERPSRRRHRRGAMRGSQDDQQDRVPRASHRRSREAEQQTSSPMTLRYHTGSTNIAQGQAQMEPPTGKPRYYWSDQVSGADWVYRPVK